MYRAHAVTGYRTLPTMLAGEEVRALDDARLRSELKWLAAWIARLRDRR